MTMEEMARIIGVSRITLSKVLNGKDGVSEETRQRVNEYIKDYNFTPNSQARSLVGKKEPIIGFFSNYADDMVDDNHVSSTFATEMINHAVMKANSRGYKTFLSISDKKDDFYEVERYMASGLIRGAILLGYSSGSSALKYLSNKGIPVVLINQEAEIEYPNISLVNMADENWGYHAIESLVQNNHKRLLYITCSRRRLPITRRTQGVMRALEQYKDKIISVEECNGEYSEDISFEMVKKIYSTRGTDKPTGIFAANDQMAIGAINALKSLGIRVPEDVSVIGFDDIPVSRYLSPALTTVHCDMRKFANKSVDILIDCIEGKAEPCHYEHQLEFVMRETLAYHYEG